MQKRVTRYYAVDPGDPDALELREHSRGLVPSAETAAFDAVIKGAYLRAEDDAVAALASLQHAAQLVKGLAR